MKISGNTKISEVLAQGEKAMIRTLIWPTPEFEHLQYRVCGSRIGIISCSRPVRDSHLGRV